MSIDHLELQTWSFTSTHPQHPSYDPDTTYQVTSYQLSYMRQNGGETTTQSLPPQSTSVTVGQLAKGTVYVFTLTPFNTAGAGAPFKYNATETHIDREIEIAR